LPSSGACWTQPGRSRIWSGILWAEFPVWGRDFQRQVRRARDQLRPRPLGSRPGPLGPGAGGLGADPRSHRPGPGFQDRFRDLLDRVREFPDWVRALLGRAGAAGTRSIFCFVWRPVWFGPVCSVLFYPAPSRPTRPFCRALHCPVQSGPVRCRSGPALAGLIVSGAVLFCPPMSLHGVFRSVPSYPVLFCSVASALGWPSRFLSPGLVQSCAV